MFYLIYGEDNFLSEVHLKEVLDFYLKNKPHFISYEFTKEENKNLDINELKSALLSKSLFSSVRVILLKNIFQSLNNDYLEKVFEILKESNLKEAKDTLVIFYENNDIKDNEFKKWLVENSIKVKVFDYLDNQKLVNWVKKQEEKLKINLTKEARDLIILFLENNTREIFYTLNQLSRFKKKIIDREFLEKNSNLPIKTNIFDFLDYVSFKKTALAFKLLKKEIEAGSHPLFILKMIISQFRNLIKIKSLEDADERSVKLWYAQSYSLVNFLLKVQRGDSFYQFCKRIRDGD
ncbi:MAG: DNA polymerase III subunit delta, partial [Minisyncoccia bacterium]